MNTLFSSKKTINFGITVLIILGFAFLSWFFWQKGKMDAFKSISTTDPSITGPRETSPSQETAPPFFEDINPKNIEGLPKDDPLRDIASPKSLNPFGEITLKPDLFLAGHGSNIDSPEFFEADDPQNTLLFVSGKNNDLIEVWKFPFANNELSPLKRDSLPNGLDVDQDKKLLLIGDADEKTVETFSLPSLSHASSIGKGDIAKGETNLDTLTLPDGKKQIYVSEDHKINVFDLDLKKYLFSFSPKLDNIEEVLADSFHQIIYVPEENGGASRAHPGGAILAFRPDGKEYSKNGSSVFGQKLFTGDEEGLAIYACTDKDGKDNGQGFIIAANQAPLGKNKFLFFNRMSWQYLGSLFLEGVSGTDGITVTNKNLPGYPQGILAVSNADTDTALISWEKITEKTSLICP